MFRNMKIAKKLIISFLIVVLLSSISGVVGIVLLRIVNSSYEEAMVANGFVLGDIGDYNTYLTKGGALVRDVIMLTDPEEIAGAQAELLETQKITQNALAATKVNCQSPEEQEILAKMEAAIPKYQEARERAVALGLQNKNEEALRVFREEARPYLTVCTAGGEELMELNVKMGKEVSINLDRQSQNGILIMLCVVIISAITALILAFSTSKSISNPVKACAARLVRLAEGDLHSPVPAATSKDETGDMLDSLKTTTQFINSVISDLGEVLGGVATGDLGVSTKVEFKGDYIQMKRSIDTILDALNSTLGQINQASDQVNSGSDQVSSGAQALSQGATEQASSVQELAATINEISQQVKDNANNALDANTKADRAGNEAVESNEKMGRLIEAMKDISNSSQEIGKVIKTIEDIAFQTNILALNAAVEAARAGAAGKGFAVVADEVRNLASKSAEAAKGTTDLIEGAIRAVENGTMLVDDTAKSLTSVVEGAMDVSNTIKKISAASEEQARAISQITLGIDQISAVVQTNSATAEESAAASEELSSQAQVLKGLVGEFKLRTSNYDGEPGLPAPRRVTQALPATHYSAEGY